MEDALVRLLERQPGRIWMLMELVDALQPQDGFRDLRVPTESINLIAKRAAEAGRIQRVGQDGWRASYP